MYKLFTAIFLMFLVTPLALSEQAVAEEPSYTAISDDGTVIVQVYPSPCLPPTLDLIKEEYQPNFKKASVIVKGKVLQACWTFEEDSVTVITQESSGTKIPTKIFKLTETL